MGEQVEDSQESLHEEVDRLRQEVARLRPWQESVVEEIKKFALAMKHDYGEVEGALIGVVDRLNSLESGAIADQGGQLPWSLRASERDWQDLTAWVDWLRTHYVTQPQLHIAPCWPAHGGVVEELAALRSSWRAATQRDTDPARVGSDLAHWHQNLLWPTIERIRLNYPIAECEADHIPDPPAQPTDIDALTTVMAEAAAGRRRWESRRFTYGLEADAPYTPGRPGALWRRLGEDWEYLSLLDWQWHRVEENGTVHPPKPEDLHPVTGERAVELEADRQKWVRYWALYVDEAAHRAGEEPTTVVRRRRSPERTYDEAFTVGNVWAPTTAVFDFFDPRPSNPPHLVEIDRDEAERLLYSVCGVLGATEL
ncbi:hypothetical protein [Streptomyces netropsis]|uniref:Uncharacterized protein n=1 Tax=Streptomyces netropsis TaxID=55404 RepID=A0A7W7PFE0_STRNE|nr:hypothetical protein [Streptomyces netropsis]MBB4887612.1 hypothetical protein [Streptomyces netropsis]GGR34554.1 hypothetical protein GCM10010219_44430 [Streptomyces netropsis]